MNVDRRYNRADAELLAVCARLTVMQAEWQRLYDATSDTGPLTTGPIWPGNIMAAWSGRVSTTPAEATTSLEAMTFRQGCASYGQPLVKDRQPRPPRSPRWKMRLDTLKPATIAGRYCCRWVRDVAGFDTHSLGEEAASAASLEPMA